MSHDPRPNDAPAQRIDLQVVRNRLAGSQGRRYFKSLEELADTPEFQELLHREFPVAASLFTDEKGRREFMRVMGASLALAGLAACTRQPEEKIVPYVRQPEDVVPGRPLFYATAALLGGYANGVLVESHLGRPTKVEGNPDHPASLGATDAYGQAWVLGLYDPDRSQTLTQLGEIRTWGSFLAAIKTAVEAQRPGQGAGIRILTETITSPTLTAQLDGILAEFPKAKWHQWEPANRDNVRAGARLAFGEPVEVRYNLDKADIVVCLDADFVSEGPGRLRAIREFASRRKLSGEQAHMNRLYAVESTVSLTGSLADHRLPLRPSQIEGFARALAAGLGLPVGGGVAHPWVEPVVKDLNAHRGAALVMAGESQPPAVHALAHAMNQQLGAVGQTVVYTETVERRPVDQLGSLKELVEDMKAGHVDLLLVLGGNPVYTAPADVPFAQQMDKVPLRIHLGLHDDETAERCHWHIPETHPLEAWSDACAFDGTVTILQPLIAPLYAGAKSAHEVLAAFTKRPERAGHDIVKDHWKGQYEALKFFFPNTEFERVWQRSLHDGVVAHSELTDHKKVAAKMGDWAKAPAASPPPAGLEIAFRPDPTVHDGRFANNGWLQELPKPLTKLTWDNAVLMSLETAKSLGVSVSRTFAGRAESGGVQTAGGTMTDVVELTYKGRTVQRAPAWIVPGHPDGVVTVHLGNGRKRAGRVGNTVGFDAYSLRTSDGMWSGSGVELRKTGEQTMVACTQDHWSIEGRNILRAKPLEEFLHEPEIFKEMGEEPKPEMSLYPPHPYPGHAWGMTIDLNSCVGCNACVTACQAENNIPVVGKEQVGRGREMHWIRVDRYYAGEDDKALGNPETYHQPVLCMQCENAPCEVVCPVAATTHSDEGLNDMVYNRCVGTRYCSNNCPYKVRRFNFFLYQDWTTETLKLQRNPDVTVRSRGVMEKCTYCVQRINQARIDAKIDADAEHPDGRAIRDGEIKTACQQACPAEAIRFGDINDKASQVNEWKASPRNYGMLAELNTRPRTSYLAAVRNPNPELERG
jgi:molybdopterin-containing oxidoreductase family iron-sulfur binding subunit